MSHIRLANVSDIDQIMKFIDDNWKENHILARDKDFFIYEHQDNNTINYVISLEDNKINGVLGFIKYSDNNSDIATVIWKVLKSDTNPMLGIELLEFLRNNKEYNIVFSPGINKKTIGIYNYLDIYTNHLNQFLIVNNSIKDYKILQIKDEKKLIPNDFIINTDYILNEITDDELKFNFDDYNYIPHKDKTYFIKRYFNHPIYNYTVYAIKKKEILSSLIVTREVIVGDSKILRIMDYLGDETDMVFISKYLYQIILDNNYEYIDAYGDRVLLGGTDSYFDETTGTWVSTETPKETSGTFNLTRNGVYYLFQNTDKYDQTSFNGTISFTLDGVSNSLNIPADATSYEAWAGYAIEIYQGDIKIIELNQEAESGECRNGC